MYRNKIWSFDIPLLIKRARITVGLKRREKPIPEFEQLGKVVDEFKKAVNEAVFKELKNAGIRASRTGKKLHKIMMDFYNQ